MIDRAEVSRALAKNRVIGIVEVHRGGLVSSMADPAQVFKPAILANATGIIVAHNHPSGDCEPSGADRDVTEKLRQVGELLDIPVVDHIIVGHTGDGWQHRSFSAEGWL